MAQVIRGAEPWSADGGEVGVLVLHGLTGNPVSMRPLAEELARRGFAVELPRLPGHGTRWQELQKTTWCDWAREARAGLEHLRARTGAVVVAGLSMGATLALHLAQARGGRPDGLVLVNPTVTTKDPAYTDDRWVRLLPALQWVLPAVRGVGNDIAKPGADEKPYPRMPLKAFASFLRLQAQVRRRLCSVDLPTLVLTSRHDHVVPPEDSLRVLDGISSTDAEHVWLEDSYHVATLDHDLPRIAEATAGFARRLAPA
ncbi:alpha/beta fold hydrolase [soil metagenome]